MKMIKKTTSEEAFEKACKELGLDPKNLPIVDLLPEKDQKSIIAYYKLTIIIRALNEGWEADFSNHNQCKYWNWIYVDAAGVGCSCTNNTATRAYAYIGSRLCFKSRELAQYAIDQFMSLYEEYLLIKKS